MITFKTNIDNNDLELGKNGELTFLQDIEAVAQESRHFAATLRGEMIHAKQNGIPYLQDIFTRIPNLAQIEAALRRRLMSLSDVSAITALTASINGDILQYTAIINTVYGEVPLASSLSLSEIQ